MRRSIALLLALVLSVPAYAQSVLLGNGSAASPSLRFNNSLTTGLYRFGADTLGFATAGKRAGYFTPDSTFRIFGRFLTANGTAAAPSITFNSSTGSGVYRFGADTLGFAVGGTGIMLMSSTGLHPVTNGAVDLGTAARRWNDVRALNANISTINGGNVNASTSFAAANGAVATPSYTFTNSGTTGLYRFGVDTIGFATGGAHSLRLSGGASPTIAGGAGNMTIVAGTGNSRTVAIQPTTGAGVATTAVTFSAGSPTPLTTFVGNVRNDLGSATTPAYSFDFGTGDGMYLINSNPDTLAFANQGAVALRLFGSSIVGGASNMTLLAGTGASRTMTLQTTTSGSVVKNTLVLGADSSATFLGKVVAADTIKVNVGSGAGIISGSNSGLTILAAPSGNNANMTLRVTGSGGAVTSVMTGTTNGTASSGAVQFQNGTTSFPSISFSSSSNSGWRLGDNGSTDTLVTQVGGTGYSFLTAVRDSITARTVITGDTIRATSKVRLTSLTAASGTPNTVCMNSSTKEVTENAATSCVVSSRRFKHDIVSMNPTDAQRIIGALRPVTFTYNDGNRKAMGLIAEEADSVDSRLASRDGQGRVNSVNYEQVTVVNTKVLQDLLKTVEAQQKQIDDLKKDVQTLKRRQ